MECIFNALGHSLGHSLGHAPCPREYCNLVTSFLGRLEWPKWSYEKTIGLWISIEYVSHALGHSLGNALGHICTADRIYNLHSRNLSPILLRPTYIADNT